MSKSERKITLNRAGQDKLRAKERACLDCSRYDLKVGTVVQLQIKGDSCYEGTGFERYIVKSIKPRPGYMSGNQSDIEFARLGDKPVNPYLTPEQAAMPTCAHADADGFCDTGSCSGALCCHCESYQTSATPAVVAAPTNYYQRAVNEQYRTVCAKTGEFFREVVKFGALLDEVSSFLGEARGNNDEEGLKGWLEENCPDVNYFTAIGYKAMAGKCAKIIGGGGTQAIAALQGKTEIVPPGKSDAVAIDAEIIEARDNLFNTVDSRRKLEQMWFDFCGRQSKAKGGRPKAGEAALPKASKQDEAKAIWNGLMQAAMRSSVKDAIPLLPERETQICLDGLRVLCDALKTHLAEFK